MVPHIEHTSGSHIYPLTEYQYVLLCTVLCLSPSLPHSVDTLGRCFEYPTNIREGSARCAQHALHVQQPLGSKN
jgi:hypothetical protein